jgi:ubiquitin carboxyl-terminal hydrolase 22/27/51
MVPENATDGSSDVAPEILYDLFGTVNHRGCLQSGHYFSNVKVKGKWFRLNDQHVSASNEAAVLSSDGAYILFYTRR